MISTLACLATAIYFEARGESLDGQLAVAEVIINRVASPDFPNDVCGVVWQKKQFSWTHDGKSDKPKDKAAYAVATDVAKQALSGDVLGHGATFYHAEYVQPYWRKHFTYVGKIGTHIFYADD